MCTEVVAFPITAAVCGSANGGQCEWGTQRESHDHIIADLRRCPTRWVPGSDAGCAMDSG